MLTEAAELPRTKAVSAAPSLATDLSWLLSVAARPSMQARYPKLAEMFKGREDLADRVRSFWNDSSEEICFTEMQVLAQHAGAVGDDRSRRAVGGHRGRGGHRPARPGHALGEPRGTRDIPRALPQAPRVPRAAPVVPRPPARRSGRPWTTCGNRRCPSSKRRARNVVAQYERGRSLEPLIPTGCDILDERLPEILAGVEAGQPAALRPLPLLRLEHVPRGRRPRRHRDRRRPGRRRGPGPDRVGGPAAQGGGRSHPAGHPALAGHRAEHRGRAGAALPAGPAHGEHARQGAAGERPRALGAPGRAAPAERRRRRRSSCCSTSYARPCCREPAGLSPPAPARRAATGCRRPWSSGPSPPFP